MPYKCYTIECPSCQGTGLYVGIGEARYYKEYDGAAVVCYNCEGTGKKEIESSYEEFTGIKPPRDGVKHVWACNPGIVTSPDVVSGGIPLKMWQERPELVHQRGAEMRSHVCPEWWYSYANTKLMPGWDECLGSGRWDHCKMFSRKNECWNRFDAEHPVINPYDSKEL